MIMKDEAKQHFYKHMEEVAKTETYKIKQNIYEETGRMSGIKFMLDEIKIYLTNIGTENDKTSEEHVKTKKRVIIDIGKVKALRAAGWSYDKISEEFGCSPQTIINHLNSHKEGD